MKDLFPLKHMYISSIINKACILIKDLKREVETTTDSEYALWCCNIIKDLKLLINQIQLKGFRKKFNVEFTSGTIRALNVLIDYSPTDEV